MARLGLESRVLVCGHDLAVLNRIDLDVERGLSLFQPEGSSKEIFVPLGDQNMMKSKLKDFLNQDQYFSQYDYLMLSHQLVDLEISELIRSIHKLLAVWTIDDQKDLFKLKGLEIESVTSNVPIDMRSLWEEAYS